MIALSGQLGMNLCAQGYGGLQERAADADNMETRTFIVDDEKRTLNIGDDRRIFTVDDGRRDLI